MVLFAIGELPKAQAPEIPSRTMAGIEPRVSPREKRSVFFVEFGDFVECPIYERKALYAGDVLSGPAIIEQMDATTVLPPGTLANIDLYGNMLIEITDEK